MSMSEYGRPLDGLRAFPSYGHQHHRALYQFLNAPQVPEAFLRHITLPSYHWKLGRPAGELLIYRLTLGQHPQVQREFFKKLTPVQVARADTGTLYTTQGVYPGKCQTLQGIDAYRVTHDSGIKPTHPSWSSGGGAVLMPAFADGLTDRVFELARKRAIAHPGSIGFGHPDDAGDAGGPHSGSDAGAPGRRV